MKKIVTRFAPSPTGNLHLGGVRTALFNFVFAKQKMGEFILRIEDTDKERSKKEYEDDLIAGLGWLGLSHDSFFRQSERGEIYKKYLKKIVSEGKAYVSKEKSREGDGEVEIVRFKNPNTTIKFDDEIRGQVEFKTEDLGDFVIAKNFEEPLYHLAVVIDDFEMEISHVIRGEDHISNTPRQILIQEALGFPRPIYAHIPLILATDRSKLSKRKHGELVSVNFYKEQGIMPEAMINFLAMLGWNPGDDRDILSLEEIISCFDFKKVQKSGAVFNVEKLEWLNQQYIKNLRVEEKIEKVKERLEKNGKTDWVKSKVFGQEFVELICERIKKWADIDCLINDGDLDFFFNEPSIVREKIVWEKNPNLEKTIIHLEKSLEILESIDNVSWKTDIIKERLMAYADKEGRGEVLWPLRYALSGKDKSSDPFTTSFILGKDNTIARWQKAIEILKQ